MTQDEIEEIAFKWTGKPSARNVDADTFRRACTSGDTDLVRAALEHNKSLVNTRGKIGMTPLMLAALQGHKDVVRLLIDNGANINAVNEDNGTPLMAAVNGNNLDIVKLFIDSNADLEIRSCEDKTALAYAITLGHYEVAKLLAESGADVNAVVEGVSLLMQACVCGWGNMAELLIKNGADINTSDISGRTALMFVLREILRWLNCLLKMGQALQGEVLTEKRHLQSRQQKDFQKLYFICKAKHKTQQLTSGL